jgi:hypothetical protein
MRAARLPDRVTAPGGVGRSAGRDGRFRAPAGSGRQATDGQAGSYGRSVPDQTCQASSDFATRLITM